jgi:LmbE family N-acetylglucosaminyl deacetylase
MPADIQALARSVRASRNSAPIVEFPDARSVVVVGAHPDDETALAGGTMALLSAQGSHIVVVLATAGEGTKGSDLGTDEIRTKRVAEAGEACRIIGAGEPVVLGYPDGSVAEHINDLVTDLSRIIAHERPQLVFAPWWLDDHPDHKAVAEAVIKADIPDGVMVWFGEIWTPLIPNRIVDITAVIELKRRALAAHRTAREALDLAAFLGLNRYRSVRGLRGEGYAEAFLVTSPESARALLSGPHV